MRKSSKTGVARNYVNENLIKILTRERVKRRDPEQANEVMSVKNFDPLRSLHHVLVHKLIIQQSQRKCFWCFNNEPWELFDMK